MSHAIGEERAWLAPRGGETMRKDGETTMKNVTHYQAERSMKILHYLLAALLTIAGVALLLNGPLEAQTPKAFAPTRFTVVDEGTAGKPDVVLIPGLASGRDTWDKEAA